MKHTLLHTTPDGERTFVLVFDAGDEVVQTLTDFAGEQALVAGAFTAIGALSRATLSWFDLDTEKYLPIPVDEQTEVLSFLGNLSQGENGKPKVHPHMVLGKRDGSTVGGHPLEGFVRPTLELTLTEQPARLRRVMDERFGIALIQLD